MPATKTKSPPMLDYVLAQLTACKGQWPKLEKPTRVSYRTITKIAQGETEDPGVKTVQALHDFFRLAEAVGSIDAGIKLLRHRRSASRARSTSTRNALT